MSAFIGLSEHYERFSANRVAQASFAALAVLVVSSWVAMPLWASLRRKHSFNPAGKVCMWVWESAPCLCRLARVPLTFPRRERSTATSEEGAKV